MLVKDETKYCWCVDEEIGDPQKSIKDAIADYVDNEYNYGDFDSLSREELLQTTIEIGHPYKYVPEIDGERVIDYICDYDVEEEIVECLEPYMWKLSRAKREHVEELGDELTKVYREWEKRHGYENRIFIVMETEQYRISDYINK